MTTTVPAGEQARLYRGLPYSDFRRRAQVIASARRDLWREMGAVSRRDLIAKRQACLANLRSDDPRVTALHSADLWWSRMIATELDRRSLRSLPDDLLVAHLSWSERVYGHPWAASPRNDHNSDVRRGRAALRRYRAEMSRRGVTS